MDEMKSRGYKPDEKWLDKHYRGSKCQPYRQLPDEVITKPLYPEHDQCYLLECIDNLKAKGIQIKS